MSIFAASSSAAPVLLVVKRLTVAGSAVTVELGDADAMDAVQ
ncbi:hypothetical protein ACXX9E_28855 [Pseudomonas sp. GNP014]